jgi:tetrapyrrole methylase family protein/MazG family protein
MAPHSSITIAGVGPGNPLARTRALGAALSAAEVIILRTAIHPGVDDLVTDSRVVVCDDLYESMGSFDETYTAIADRVLGAAASNRVVYLVPGSAAFGERTVQMIRQRAADSGIPVTMLPAVSALDEIAAALGIDLLTDQPQLIDAADLVARVDGEPFSGSQIVLDPTRWAIVSQVFDRRTASDVKHALTRVWPEDYPVTVVRGAGTDGEVIESMPLSELDHVEHDHLTTVVIQPMPWLDASASPATLFRIIATLRSPEGCPWDREQTHASLSDKVIEEAHEVAEAIALGDPDELRDELGDLLLLVALNAQIAEEAGDFTIEDVFRAVNSKLVRRHPHVFGNVVAETPNDVLKTWTAIKAAEKGDNAGSAPALRYDQLPRTMSVIERIRRAEGAKPASNQANESHIGAGLLTLIEQALEAGFDPESALERAYREKKASTDNHLSTGE